MSKRIYPKYMWATISLLALFLSGCNRVKADFQKICENATEMKVEDKFPASNFYAATEKTLKTDEAKLTWKAMTVTDPADRYGLLQSSASEVGLKDYQCESLKAHLAR